MDEFVLPPPYDHVSAEELDRDRTRFVERLRKTGRPAMLEVESGAEIVIQSTQAYRRLLERLETAEESVEIYRGTESGRRGDALPLDEAFRQIREGTGETAAAHGGGHRREAPLLPSAISSEEFDRGRDGLIGRLQGTRQPARLALDDQSEIVIQSAGAYRELLAKLDYTEALVGIYRGMEDVRMGRTRPLEESFRRIRERAERRRRTA